MKRLLLTIGMILMIVLTAASAFASSAVTTETSNGYEVQYTINQPGWYLLPTESSFASLYQNPGAGVFESLAVYKFYQNPVTMQLEQCSTKMGNKLTCASVNAVKNKGSLAYNGAWSYYDTPTTVTFHWDHALTMGMYDSGTLRKGWNLVSFPPHLAAGKSYLGNCDISKAFVWNSAMQRWESVNLHAMGNYASLSGKGMALKVMNNCQLVDAHPQHILPPPAVMNDVTNAQYGEGMYSDMYSQKMHTNGMMYNGVQKYSQTSYSYVQKPMVNSDTVSVGKCGYPQGYSQTNYAYTQPMKINSNTVSVKSCGWK